MTINRMYRKKPVVIEAMRLDADNAKDVCDWINANVVDGLDFGYREDGTVMIRTLEGEMTASLGDFVIRGVKGEFYPCKPDIFEATYDAVMG